MVKNGLASISDVLFPEPPLILRTVAFHNDQVYDFDICNPPGR